MPGFLDAELNQHVVLPFLFPPIRQCFPSFSCRLCCFHPERLVFSATKSGRQINDLFGVAFWLGANMGEKKQQKQLKKKEMLIQLGSASKASFGVKPRKKVVQTKPASIGCGRYCHLGDPMIIIHCFHLWPEKNGEKSRVGKWNFETTRRHIPPLLISIYSDLWPPIWKICPGNWESSTKLPGEESHSSKSWSADHELVRMAHDHLPLT